VNPLLSSAERRRIGRAVLRSSADNELDPQLVTAIILVESGARPWALSPKGAVGLMQVMPHMTEARMLAGNLTTIESNVAAGCSILADNIRRLGETTASRPTSGAPTFVAWPIWIESGQRERRFAAWSSPDRSTLDSASPAIRRYELPSRGASGELLFRRGWIPERARATVLSFTASRNTAGATNTSGSSSPSAASPPTPTTTAGTGDPRAGAATSTASTNTSTTRDRARTGPRRSTRRPAVPDRT
jgi:hypothetical protein